MYNFSRLFWLVLVIVGTSCCWYQLYNPGLSSLLVLVGGFCVGYAGAELCKR